MKINERLFPTIIIVSFVLFLILAILLGFRPVHGGDQSSAVPASFMLALLGGGAL